MDAPGLPREEFLRHNNEFHAKIGAAAGNRRLFELIATEQAATATYVSFLGIEPASREDARAEHGAVLAALRAGDEDAAAAAMERHLMHPGGARDRAGSPRRRHGQR